MTSSHPTPARLIVLLDEFFVPSSDKVLSHLLRATNIHPPLTLVGGVSVPVIQRAIKRLKGVVYNNSPDDIVPLEQLLNLTVWSDIWYVRQGVITDQTGQILARS